jgi:branched-chain amino acid transport system ATP-binding protein
MLSLRSVRVQYGKAVAVHRVSLEVPAGEWTLIVGPNGAGKTSLLRAAMGLVTHGGAVCFEGDDLTRMPAWDRQRRGLGFVPEGRQLFSQMTVEENLRAGGYRCSAASLRHGIAQAYETFPRLAERRGQLASTMSGGEQQMLALARALIAKPKLLLVDEVSWGLSPVLVQQVFAQLRALHRAGLSLLQVEQNAYEALKHAQTVHVMSAGAIALSGPVHEIAADPRIIENYVGS